MKRFLRFLQKEAVLCICALLAVLSALAVPPDGFYLGYIDFRVLALLFCLMAVVGSAKEQGVFGRLCRGLLHSAGNTRRAALLLVLLPFFCSMLVTNDVALITFVPIAVGVLGGGSPELLAFVVVMQTIAANLGSCLTPFGNPQNLYLSACYSLSAGQFLGVVGPLALAGLALCVGGVLARVKPRPIAAPAFAQEAPLSRPKLLLCGGLFLLCVAAVLRAVDWRIALAVVTVLLLAFHREAFRHVDVSLLATFVCLFVFVGNMGRVEPVRQTLAALIAGRAMPVSALASQFISNVPAALMLSGFTDDWAGLLLGTNIGGLGTPIASMASLISLRCYSRAPGADTRRYLVLFSAWNFGFLALLLAGAAATSFCG